MKLLTEPYLLTTDASTEMNILWIQNEKADGIVEFGFDENLDKKIVAECFEIIGLRAPLADGTYGKTPEEHEEISVWQCIAKIDNLKVGQKIYYRCIAGDKSTKIYDFHTAPQPGGEYTFAQMSDLQGLEGCNDTVYKAGCMHPDFILLYATGKWCAVDAICACVFLSRKP